jgi:putative spermidine/putrescine transport system ATP-binding protein
MHPARGHSLTLDRVTHSFGAAMVVEDVDLQIGAGELVALLGPSGCGKSTLLRIVAGFIAQSGGRVLFDDASVDPLPPNRRGVGIVFQNYALFPHMSVAENVAYGLAARRTPRAEARRRLAAMLALVRMGDFAERLPRQLSGGQQQRVALARALAVEPKILLLDEPFGALDKNLRLDMQIEIKRLQRETGVTTVMVTHDQEEALAMADRVAVMRHGRIEQFASPSEVYDTPETLFVSRFVGSTNLLPGRVAQIDGADAHVALDCGARVAAVNAGKAGVDSKVFVSVRPEHIRLASEAKDGRVPATVRLAMPLGPVVVYELQAPDGTSMKLTQPRELGLTAMASGASVFVEPTSRAACRVFAQSPTLPSPASGGG